MKGENVATITKSKEIGKPSYSNLTIDTCSINMIHLFL